MKVTKKESSTNPKIRELTFKLLDACHGFSITESYIALRHLTLCVEEQMKEMGITPINETFTQESNDEQN